MARKVSSQGMKVETLAHKEASRKNIPTAEFESIVEAADKTPIRVAIDRRNRDLDPQLVWRGKDEQDASPLNVLASPLYIQEKIHPKALIDDLRRTSRERAYEDGTIMADLFADFNGIPKGVDKTEFYQHEQNWSNRMILGDSLQVMGSLAEREGLRGKVQCIYIDPPYGIKFNSNFQWSTTSRDVKDGDVKQITREPEQVKAFRDTWRDGIHSYLSYLRDRLTIARELMTTSGSVFVQMGDENVHVVRSLMDEVFGAENFVSQIAFTKTPGLGSSRQLVGRFDLILWYAKSKEHLKYRVLFEEHPDAASAGYTRIDPDRRELGPYMSDNLTKPGPGQKYEVDLFGKKFDSGRRWWGYPPGSIDRLYRAGRIEQTSSTIRYKRFFGDYRYVALNNLWEGFGGAKDPQYVVQTNESIVQRCILMVTDAGDLVLDPTCGSGTTATVSERWGRRWIVIDTSRVALALARARIMGGRYPYYLLADSLEGQLKEAELMQVVPSSQPTYGDVRHGFVYERVPHVTLKSIANNSEIDVIWQRWQHMLEPLLASLNQVLNKSWQEWDIPREAGSDWSSDAKTFHAEWWKARISCQKEIDASITTKAESEYLYDKPYEAKKIIRVAGPFTVESLSPHRIVGVGPEDELLDPATDAENSNVEGRSFVETILDNLKTAGVQQTRKTDKISFTSLVGWPGEYICAEGRYREGDADTCHERRAAIFIGPEFGTVLKADLTAAAREAADAGFDVLIACAFAYEAYASEVVKLGRLQILKARMNADLHMAEDLKKTEKANLFVIFGEPDIDMLEEPGDKLRLKINGVDVFHPATGEVRSDGPNGIACWFIDTDYNEESFFVRHAYFLGANDPYDALKKTLKAEIDEEAWESLHSDVSRAFPKPKSGRIAVKVINHLGDEVMKVFKVGP